MQTPVLSVSELTHQIKKELESLFPSVTIRGEISNFKRHGSGHLYLTLKDEGAQIPAVVWKSTAATLPREIGDGMDVIAKGRIEVYPPSGRYQLICSSITPAGQGALQQAFAILLEKLAKAGWFSAACKKPVPKIPSTIGLVTSRTGAVIEDMSNVLQRRFPAARLLLYPVKVQGKDAAPSIVEAIAWFNRCQAKNSRPDVIIIARGGGSLEDLQAFNEESVASAIHHSTIPVISAVGHETDLTIADMVADLRAGTPSIAAELAAPDNLELLRQITAQETRLATMLKARIEGAQRQVDSITGSYAFNRPFMLLEQFEQRLSTAGERMAREVESAYTETFRRYEAAVRHLELLDYRKTLERGYVLVEKKGDIITSSSGLAPREEIALRFHDGTRPALITDGNAP